MIRLSDKFLKQVNLNLENNLPLMTDGLIKLLAGVLEETGFIKDAEDDFDDVKEALTDSKYCEATILAEGDYLKELRIIFDFVFGESYVLEFTFDDMPEKDNYLVTLFNRGSVVDRWDVRYSTLEKALELYK